jgi:hypothetical protein
MIEKAVLIAFAACVLGLVSNPFVAQIKSVGNKIVAATNHAANPINIVPCKSSGSGRCYDPMSK